MESQWTMYLDKNTFLRHFLVGELSGNTDTYWSVYMYKDRDNDQMYTGPVWDFDLAFDNDNRTYPVCGKSDYIYRSGGSCAGKMKTFVDNIVVKNAEARAQMLNIWDEARQAGLTEDNHGKDDSSYHSGAHELHPFAGKDYSTVLFPLQESSGSKTTLHL